MIKYFVVALFAAQANPAAAGLCEALTAGFKVRPKVVVLGIFDPSSTGTCARSRDFIRFQSWIDRKYHVRSHPFGTWDQMLDLHFPFIGFLDELNYRLKLLADADPSTKSVFINLQHFSVPRAFARGLAPGKDRTKREIEMILNNESYFRITRWFQNRQELTPQGVVELFGAWFPAIQGWSE